MHQPVTNIMDLPIEVLWKILSYVAFEDMKSIELVNSDWSNILLSPQIWKNKVFRTKRDDTNENISKIICSSPLLQSIEFTKEVSPDVFKNLWKHSHLLRKLHIAFQTEVPCYTFENIIQSCGMIEELTLNRLLLSESVLSDIVGQMRNLKKLFVDGSVYFERFIILEPIANGCPNLECLNIKREICSFEEVSYFIKRKQEMLRSLAIMWYPEEDRNCITPLLKTCNKLESLSIYTSSWDSPIPKGAFEAISTIRTLKELVIPDLDRSIPVYPDDVACAFKNGSLYQLQILDISFYGGLDDGLIEIICKNCPNLKHLDLSGGKNLGDSAFVTIGNCQSLEYLCLAGCSNLTDASLHYIINCLKLEVLNLNRCNLLTVNGLHKVCNLVNLRVLHIRYCNTDGLVLNSLIMKLQRLEWLTMSHSKLVNCEVESRNIKLTIYDDSFDLSSIFSVMHGDI